MVHWVYVLDCEDDYIYVGETTRLFRRFKEHLKNRGGLNTTNHKPKRLIGLYKVSENNSFLNYRNKIKNGEYNKFYIDNWEDEGDNLLIENHITERFLYERRDNDYYGCGLEWYKVRGGKYTKDTLNEIVDNYKWASEKEGRTCSARNPIQSIPIDSIVDRPLCKCYNPSEVKISKDKSKIYFVCALKNVWGDFCSDLEVSTPCDFWQPYNEDIYVKKQYEINTERLKEPLFLNIPKLPNKYEMEKCVMCDKLDYEPIYAYGCIRKLCQHCLGHNYDAIKDKYSINRDGCLISIF
jgi:predicted GIY-YIG superfamily endonuclease